VLTTEKETKIEKSHWGRNGSKREKQKRENRQAEAKLDEKLGVEIRNLTGVG